MALSGMSIKKIADILNDDEIPTPATYAGVKVGHPGPNTGLWYGDCIADILKNEVYIGNMIQGQVAKVSYKSKKFIRRSPDQWSRVEHTHEPIIDEDMFRKVSLLIRSRKSTRSSTYDCLLKGIIYCHECQTPLAILNRPNTAGQVRLYFVCRTYHRNANNKICGSHCILVDTLTNAILNKIRQICSDYLEETESLSAEDQAAHNAQLQEAAEAEITALENAITLTSTNLEQIYTDRLTGVLAPDDFQRFYEKNQNRTRPTESKAQKYTGSKKVPCRSRGRAKRAVKALY